MSTDGDDSAGSGHVVSTPLPGSGKNLLERILPWSELLRNIATIVGAISILIALRQLGLANEVALRAATLEVLTPLKDRAFIDSLSNLIYTTQAASVMGRPFSDINNARLANDRNLVLSVYDSVAIWVTEGKVERCVVKAHVEVALPAVLEALEHTHTPDADYRRIDDLKSLMMNTECTP